jgi:hypothetical protein
MDDSYLVMDIETVPQDARQGTEPPPVEGGEDPPFPVLVHHRIVSIGALWLDGDLRFKRLGVMGEGKPEERFLADFHDFMGRYRPVLVTFNGRRFDMPVVVLRSMVHGLTMGWYFSSQEYRRRYEPTRHLDLCDALSEHGAGRFPALGDMAAALGLPGKLGMDGGDVLEVWRGGDMDRIHAYCLMDVIQTAFVLMRWKLVTGRLDRASHRQAADSLREAVDGDGRFAELVAAARWADVVCAETEVETSDPP